MSISDRLDEIQARANAATDGPWWTEFWLDDLSWREGHYSVLAKKDDPVRIVDPSWETSEEQTKADAEFIAHARSDVPDLVGALQAVLDLCDSTTLECRPGDGSQPYMVVPVDVVKSAIEVALEEARP